MNPLRKEVMPNFVVSKSNLIVPTLCAIGAVVVTKFALSAITKVSTPPSS